ncbi:rhomboid family intramembrane serine protease [Microbacterium esteraromaticum]|uniref:rhomboid family intramembrane serine protease n=1 Tax=Microbacterium esteraromaticum TaxID=57043 RepID=UPI0019565263|nr:rhomboid family intramembrane serine protease [Microbacterium esteraromaticum]MBM7466065.1 membrane associated rhomboid family serine protease [Microbacterium esteraromaticum]
MTSPDFTRNRENFCYRHPDRQSFVLCQRCTRTICADCQTQAPVGVICPECMKADRKAQTPAQRRANRVWSAGNGSSQPIATYTIIGITAVVGVLQVLLGPIVDRTLLFATPYLFPDMFAGGFTFQPWRLLTAMLVHSGIMHFALNMLALWMIGRSLEPLLGRWRFVALYLIGGLGGSVAMAVLDPGAATVGASGGVFALMGALLVIGRHIGANIRGILVILAINLAIGFIQTLNIAWQAHIGGAAVGALIGLIFARTRKHSQRVVQILLLAGLVIALLALAFLVSPVVIRGTL